ncbi:MAG: hypothetical protein ACI8RD_005230 [Bacillariaceae sp.]|jgi:hypothetical protein
MSQLKWIIHERKQLKACLKKQSVLAATSSTNLCVRQYYITVESTLYCKSLASERNHKIINTFKLA